MRKLICVLTFIIILVATTGAYAFGAVSGDHYLLPNGEVHRGDLAVSADKVVIEGTVDGDLYVFSESVQVLGEVTGDVISFSANTTVLGKVGGNIRSFTQNLTISGTVDRSVTTGSHNMLITEQGQVKGNLLLFVDYADLHGKVGREMNGMVKEVRVTGEIGQGISMLKTNMLRLDSTAIIGGDLAYSSPQRALIANGATIKGEEHYSTVLPENEEHLPFFPLVTSAASLLSTLLIWVAIRFLFPAALYRVHQQFDGQLPSLLGLGAAVLVAAVILTVLLLVTMVGIPVAVIVVFMMVDLTFAAKVFVGSWAGQRLRERFGWRLHPLLAELLGVVALQCLILIPFFGWLLSLPVWMVFLGAVARAVRQTNKTFLP